MRNHPNALMIFAAGFGTRMGALTKHQPKPLITVAGKPLIDYALDIAGAADIETIVVNTHYLADQMSEHLLSKGAKVSLEAETILETGGGLRNALPLLGNGPVFTMNSDAVWTGSNPLTTLRRAWDPDEMDGLLLLLNREDAIGHKGTGDFLRADDGRLSRGPGLVYSGAQIIKTDMLKGIPSEVFSLNLLWDKMVKSGRLFGARHEGGWCDVGHPGGIIDAERLLKGENHV